MRLGLLFPLLALPIMMTATAAPVSGWQFGLGSTQIHDPQTNHPVIGPGSIDSAAHIAIHAPFAPLALENTGDKIILTGKIEFVGILPTDTQFRWGIYHTSNPADIVNWQGYFVGNSLSQAPGIVRKRKEGHYYSNEGSSLLPVIDFQGGFALKDGTYDFLLSYERLRNGSLDITWQLGDSSRNLKGTANDPQPAGYAFNRIGLLSGRIMAADQLRIKFINVALQSHKEQPLGR